MVAYGHNYQKQGFLNFYKKLYMDIKKKFWISWWMNQTNISGFYQLSSTCINIIDCSFEYSISTTYIKALKNHCNNAIAIIIFMTGILTLT